MVCKARPQLSVHSVMIRIPSAEYVTGHFHPRPNFEKYQKSSADENNEMMRNTRQEYVIIRILSVSHSRIKTYHSAVDPNLRTGTVSLGSLPLVMFSY